MAAALLLKGSPRRRTCWICCKLLRIQHQFLTRIDAPNGVGGGAYRSSPKAALSDGKASQLVAKVRSVAAANERSATILGQIVALCILVDWKPCCSVLHRRDVHFAALYIDLVLNPCVLRRFGVMSLRPALIWCHFAAFCFDFTSSCIVLH